MDSEKPEQSSTEHESSFLQVQDTKIMLTNNKCQLNNSKPADLEKIMTNCFNRPSSMLIDEILEDEPQLLEKKEALHKYRETNKEDRFRDKPLSAFPSATTVENSDRSDVEDIVEDGPNLLKLTKMKWLTETHSDSADSRSLPSSRSISVTDISISGSEENMKKCVSFGEKCLSTILRLDKEHNMFGLSQCTIVDMKMPKKPRKKEGEPAFPQTAIIQVCCGRVCCKHKSNTDLPSSLKCGSCMRCADPFCLSCTSCATCALPCGTPCALPCKRPRPCKSPCKSPCKRPRRRSRSRASKSPCPRPCRTPCVSPCGTPCRTPCSASRCLLDCATRFGMKISLKRKPEYEPSPVEITPRSSCLLQKPQAARSCHHLPHCIPPSSCFPYLMPCFWPPRASAPCNTPAQCFHNPPCRPPRRRKSPIPLEYLCPHNKKCIDASKKTQCPNPSCPGKNETLKKEIEKRFGPKK